VATTSPEGCDDTGAATSALRSRERVIADALGTTAEPICLTDLAQLARAGALRTTAAILAPDTGKELRPGEAVQIRYAHLIRFLSAGIDFIKFSELIATIPIVGNGGVRMRDLDNPSLGYPFNRSWRFASTGGSAKVAPSWVDGRDASVVWAERPLGYGS
jgi:hypothetical protein